MNTPYAIVRNELIQNILEKGCDFATEFKTFADVEGPKTYETIAYWLGNTEVTGYIVIDPEAKTASEVVAWHDRNNQETPI